MDTTTLAQTLTCAEALEWLQGTLNDPDNEDLDPDEAMSAIFEKEWETEEEFLGFFKEISIELAKTASKDPDHESASLYGRELYYALSLWSPYYKIWEKAFETKSPLLKENIDIQDWKTDIAREIETLKVIDMIPLAMAYEYPIFEALRNRAISDLTYSQEEFMGYLASSLMPGYYDGTIPIEIIHIPSSRILGEIFEDWMMYQDLWTPEIIREVLESEYADHSVKEKIAQVLRGESDSDPESWDMHRESEWTDEDIEDILQLCE